MTDIRTILGNYKVIRERLRNPLNAVPDTGIDLKRKASPLTKTSVATEPEPQPEPIEMTLTIEPTQLPLASPLVENKYDFPKYGLRNPSSVDYFNHILTITAKEFGIPVMALKGPRRSREIAWARQVAVYLAVQRGYWSVTWIGKKMNRDHTTCIHSSQIVGKRMAEDANLRARIQNLETIIDDYPAPPIPSHRKRYMAEGKRRQDTQGAILPSVD